MSDGAESDLEFDNGDQQFNEHDAEEMGDHHQNVQHHQQHHIDRYHDDGQYDLDQSFEADTDALARVKAKIMFNLNKERQLQNIPIFYEDLTLTSIAMQYAQAIKRGQTDQAYLNRLNDQQKFFLGYETCQIISKYQDDVPVTKKYTEKFFIENAYIFLQMDLEREILMEPSETHVGIGLAGSQKYIAIVILVTRKDIAITEIKQIEEERVQVQGKILTPNNFIFLAEIYDRNDNQLCFSMYDRVQFNRQTKDFNLKLDIRSNWDEKRWIKIYTTATEPIGIRKPPKEKKNKLRRDCNDKFISLFIKYPDQRYIQFYNEQIAAQKSSESGGLILESLQGQEMEMKEEEKEDSDGSSENQFKSEDNEEEMQPEDQSQGQNANNELTKEQRTSNREIKQELMAAINEAKAAFQSVKNTNLRLQGKIKEIREKNNISLDKIGESSMNEHKYLNILAQVHQTRMELQLTQQRYNHMSIELQNKLSEKQAKCNDIRSAFQDLKKEVAKKATYSRSDQPIKGSKIEEWQERESRLAEQLQNLRLQILRARNALAKNQKMLKKREQLAQGLHLIDFEQLKIQNQTLNERIEQRNQDLHKLKKKTTTMVQILTHTREKLVFVEKMKTDLLSTNQVLDIKIQDLRGNINNSKKQCEKLREQIQQAKQQTEILNSNELEKDFKKRMQNIASLEEEMKDMLEREKEMKTVIEMYQKKLKKDSMGR